MPKIFLLFLLLISCTSYELSGYDPYEKQHPYGKFGMRLFDKQDYNQDGVITIDELVSVYQALFDLIDTNLDGRMTYAEAAAANKKEKYLSFGYQTQKGYLTFDDIFAPEKRQFMEVDINRDGMITKVEFKQHYLNTLGAIAKNR